MISVGQPHYPNRFARYFFLATREVIGRHGLNAVLIPNLQERFV